MGRDHELLTSHEPHADTLSKIYIAALKELASPFPSLALPDWPKFTEVTGGFRVREFTILCGATGVGKTTFLANISAQLLKLRQRHYVASVETGHTDFVKRVMSSLIGKDINTGEAVPESALRSIHSQWGDIFNTDDAYLSLYDNRVPIETLKADLTYMATVKSCKIAMIDNLNFFMEVTRAADQIVEMDRVIHELIIFCKQVDMHVIMVMHPKKTDDGRVISEFDIKGSSTAVQEAHNVFLFNRPSPVDIREGRVSQFDRELTFQKMRRRGIKVGSRLIFKSKGSSYSEGELL